MENDINMLLEYIEKSKIVTIFGNSNSYKTTLAINISKYLSIKNKKIFILDFFNNHVLLYQKIINNAIILKDYEHYLIENIHNSIFVIEDYFIGKNDDLLDYFRNNAVNNNNIYIITKSINNSNGMSFFIGNITDSKLYYMSDIILNISKKDDYNIISLQKSRYSYKDFFAIPINIFIQKISVYLRKTKIKKLLNK